MSNWKDKLTQLFYIQAVKPVYRVMFEHRVAQFITDLRKHDEEELIKMLPRIKRGYIAVSIVYYSAVNDIKKLIKDYYAK